jgi:hypothetical protein
MKGKIKLLGHIGLMLFLVSALMLTLAPIPVQAAATAVTNVWVDFPFTASINAANSAANHYYIHFKPTTALSRGVDTVTVTFPDGSTAMGITAFSTISAVAAADLEFSTNYGTLGTDATWTICTSDATCGGYRVKVTTPINVAAGTDVWLRITSTGITSATVERSIYKVYVSTTKDTTPVLSSAFALGVSVVDSLTVTPLVPTAGVGTQYIAVFDPVDTVGVGGTVTLKFPLGTAMPSTISTSDVLFSTNGTDYSNATAATVDADLRTITGTTPIELTSGSRYMKILSGAGVANPQTATTTSTCMICTSTDAKWFVESGRTIDAGTATKVIVANGAIGLVSVIPYSDNATMINMASSYIYVTMADQYGNAKDVTGDVTVSLSSSSGTGTFYTCSSATPSSGTGTYSAVSTLTVDEASPVDVGQQVFYKNTAAGTHTLTFSAATYTSATWTITVAPAISLYDANNNLINTYGATSTAPVTELGSAEAGSTFANAPTFGVDYINDAITAAFAGDTVKLGDGIYELDAVISLNKKITLTSATSASYTTLRPTTDGTAETLSSAILIGISGTATNPVVIDGLTFDRLRSTVEFSQAVHNESQYDYVTVRNNVIKYVIPEASGTYQAVVWFKTGNGVITSATISNNTFTNCVGFNAISGGRTGVIQFYDAGGTAAMTGVTISGNTMTDCNDYGIAIGGSGIHNYTASITNNTITNGYSPIDLNAYNSSETGVTITFTVTGNTITGGYRYGIRVEGSGYTSTSLVTIKNNTITGCAGAESEGAIHILDEAGAVITVQYNDIYSNNGYAIYAVASPTGGHDCKYNWFGSATGPAYTALTGATVSKSNPNGTGDEISDKVCYFPWLHKSKVDVVTDNASYQACTMKLVVGWNTLSTPVKLIDTADAISELITSGMTIGYYYDATGWHQITTYVLNPCDAVYVKMSAVTYVLLKFDTKEFSAPSKALNAGWNLISLAYLSSSGKHADNAVASVYKTAANLPGYSQVVSPSLNATQTNMYGAAGASWAYSSGQTIADPYTETMYAGLGYWIYMQNAATLAGFEITPIAPDLD